MDLMNSKDVFNNPYIMTISKVLLLLYASQIAPKAPSYLTNLFNNIYVKIALIVLIIYMTQHDFQFALIFAIILVLGMNIANGKSLLESFSNMDGENLASYSKDFKPYGKFTLLDPKNEIYPGCANITYNDLLKIFENDAVKLQTSVQHAFYELLNDNYKDLDAKNKLIKVAYMVGLPYNLEINDENAPWIASLLVNYNFIVSNTCKAPN